jgi:hypothetical protein
MTHDDKKASLTRGLAPAIPVLARSSGKKVPFGAPAAGHVAQVLSDAARASKRHLRLAAEETAAIEEQLSRYIGSAAKATIDDEAARSVDFKEFLVAVAGKIEQPTQRDQFLAALKRSLTRRY